MAANGERRQPRRTKQHNFPIAHFYENLIRTTGTRGSIHNDNNNESIDSTSPTVQLSIASRRERFQSTKMNATMKRSTSNVSSAITRQISNKNRMSPNEIIPQNTNSARQRRMSSSANPAPKMHPAISSGNNSRFKEIKPWSRDKFAVNSKAPTGERLSIYERSQLQLKEREKKIENLRQELYQECTFQPKRSQASSEAKSNYSRRTRHHLAPITNTSSLGTARKIDASNRKKLGKSPTTCASSTPGSTQATTPTTTSTTRQCRQDPQRKQQLSSTGSKDGTFVSRMSSTVKSLRFEELYQEGVRKFRQRPATEQVS